MELVRSIPSPQRWRKLRVRILRQCTDRRAADPYPSAHYHRMNAAALRQVPAATMSPVKRRPRQSGFHVQSPTGFNGLWGPSTMAPTSAIPAHGIGGPRGASKGPNAAFATCVTRLPCHVNVGNVSSSAYNCSADGMNIQKGSSHSRLTATPTRIHVCRSSRRQRNVSHPIV